eukprot:257738-Ditylum_brightwellii.AAC.1
MEVKARRATFQARDETETKTSATQDLRSTLQIPNSLFSSFSLEQKQAFLKWKNCPVNGESILNEEISKNCKHKGSGPTSSSRQQKRKKAKKNGAMKIYCAGTQPNSNSSLSVDGKKKARANKVIRASKAGPTTMGETGFAHNTILDSGTEWT